MNNSSVSGSQHIEFIDYRVVDWANVRRIRTHFYQRFEYVYPGPIYNLKQRLMIVPADRFGAQQLLDHQLAANPSPLAIRQIADSFGNRVLELEVPEADCVVSFEVRMIVESALHDLHKPALSPADAQCFLDSTPLTMPNSEIHVIAHQMRSQATTDHDLALHINNFVYNAMRYKSGVTTVSTSAAEALMLGQGLCQDYAHLMLAICRAAGLPARYVSGHLLGEGGSHAWVEVFLPAASGLSAFAFDPTNKRQPHLGYVIVAVGRDYHDVSPTSGSFTAPYGGQLTVSKRAGLTQVEYLNGDTLHSSLVS
ncbi:MAG: transglutaminase family protein [Burkholderiales bacterium]|nr:transglutaminase family protein [Anaerolineae bacterium]